MTESQKILNKTRAHTRYKKADGTPVPGVTTITGQLSKPGLVPWANKLGLEGIDVGKYVDELAVIGTLAHYMVECQLKEVKPDLDDFTPNQVELATKCLGKFNNWLSENKFKVIKTEQELVSEKYSYGGTCDIYCDLNGKKTLIDLKTSRALYEEHKYQVAAYKALLVENGYPVEEVRILRIGRNDKEGFEDVNVSELGLHWKVFAHLKRVYELKKQIKEEK